MDDLLAQFLIEGRDLIAQAQADLDRLAAAPGDARAIDSAFRAIHTLKGSVAIFDMAAAERLLHAAEDLLQAVRAGATTLDADRRDLLVACIDQSDRWIDAFERTGNLGADADAVATMLVARLAGDGAADTTAAAAEPWLTALAGRMRDRLTVAATAFRYEPDRQCFFRGEDPLALVAAVPELLGLVLHPAADTPPLADRDPFECRIAIEGLSTAAPDVVRAAFRLVPDQVRFGTIEPASAEAPAAEGATAAVLRVDADRVEWLGEALGELIVAGNALSDVARQAQVVDPRIAAALRDAEAGIARALGGMGRAVAAVRLVSLAPVLRRLPRLAREIASGLDKVVQVELEGETLEVDKQVGDGLFEPLLHLVRNAIDHGIEAPAGRAGAGKPAAGRIRIAARRAGEEAIVALSDDGAGIDPARIRAIAIERGLGTSEAIAALDDAQALHLIFAPGFSTAATVTDVSGRGVGMDAVRSAVERLRGRIEIETAVGTGTTFRLHFPLNAITSRLLIVEAGGDRYGIPLDQVVETVRVASDRIAAIGTGVACVVRDRTLPVLSLAELLGTADPPAATATLIVTAAAGDPIALRVGRLGARIDAVVRPRGGLLGGMRGIAGTAILGDGSVLLILDLAELAA